MSQTHEHKRRIYYHDTDAGGIVYHANYLRFCEEARMELFLSLGLNVSEIAKKYQSIFVTVHSEINWKSPTFLGDLVTVKTKILSVKRSSVLVNHSIERDGKILSNVEITLVCINPEGKAIQLPTHLSQTLKGVMEKV